MESKHKALVLSALLLSAAANVQASTTYDFRSGGTSYTQVNGSGYGNGLDFGDMTASAWATTGVPTSSNSLIDEAQIHQWSTGLGACNKDEGLAFGGCNTSSEHQVDNIGDDDYVLFLFDGLVEFDNLIFDPYFKSDRDISFWIGTISGSSSLLGLDPFDLDAGQSNSIGFGGYNQKNFRKGSGAKTVNLTGANGGNIGNALLFSARADAGSYDDDDRFKIRSLEVNAVVVPVPAAAWLFGSGLLALAGFARRKSA